MYSDASLRSGDFILSLVLPKTTYRPGEQIPFEVKVDNPHGVLIEYFTLTLTQTTIMLIEKKHRFSNSRSRKSIKIDKNKVNCQNSGHGFHDTSWYGYLSVPRNIPPTILATDTPVMNIIENRYSLQVFAQQCENYPLKSEEYPITIECPGGSQAGVNATSSESRNIETGRNRSPMRRGTSLVTPNSTNLFGPPRYSSLSLNNLSLPSERSRSIETLPPNYDDTFPKSFQR